MAASAFHVLRLKRMVDEVDNESYMDGDLAVYIEQYPLPDADGLEPDEDDWTATYDLAAAAADVWEEKAGVYHDKFTFAAAGEATYQRSTKYDNAMKQVRYYRSRSVARSRPLKIDLPEDTPVWVGNINDPDGNDV